MKQSLPAIPLILLILLNSCSNSSGIPPAMSTAVVQTITAAVVTPTITFTPMYITAESVISWDLNTVIQTAEESSKFDQLEHTTGATYQIMDVDFVPNDSTASSLQLTVNCICSLNTDCCTINRAFVVTMAAMYVMQSDIKGQVPDTVNELVVICLHENSSVGSFTVAWYAVEKFLDDPINGYQLASEVTHEP